MSTFNDFSVADLLPHSGQMVLLDEILRFAPNQVSAALTVRGDGLLFGTGDTVPAWAGIEYMAQAIGCYAGLQARQAGLPIRLGFLLGTRRYESNVPSFKTGSRLIIDAESILQDQQLSVFECRIRGENIAVSATLNVYQPPHQHE